MQSVTEIDLFCVVQDAMSTKYATRDPWWKSTKNVETEEILSGHNTFCDSVPAPLKHSFSISCFMHSFWDFFSPQIKIKYFLSQMTTKQNFQKLTACPSLLHLIQNIRKKTANRPIVNLTLTIEVLLSSAPYFSNITLFNLY